MQSLPSGSLPAKPLPRLGLFNLALVSAYFVPVWGADALRALVSPFSGLEERGQAAAAMLIRDLFDLGLSGMMRTADIFAAGKLVIAAACAAYVIEFARALVRGREPDRQTTDAVLILVAGGVAVWALAATALGDAGLLRLQATQL